jgi:hypothetical protein
VSQNARLGEDTSESKRVTRVDQLELRAMQLFFRAFPPSLGNAHIPPTAGELSLPRRHAT